MTKPVSNQRLPEFSAPPWDALKALARLLARDAARSWLAAAKTSGAVEQ